MITQVIQSLASQTLDQVLRKKRWQISSKLLKKTLKMVFFYKMELEQDLATLVYCAELWEATSLCQALRVRAQTLFFQFRCADKLAELLKMTSKNRLTSYQPILQCILIKFKRRLSKNGQMNNSLSNLIKCNKIEVSFSMQGCLDQTFSSVFYNAKRTNRMNSQ